MVFCALHAPVHAACNHPKCLPIAKVPPPEAVTATVPVPEAAELAIQEMERANERKRFSVHLTTVGMDGTPYSHDFGGPVQLPARATYVFGLAIAMAFVFLYMAFGGSSPKAAQPQALARRDEAAASLPPVNALPAPTDPEPVQQPAPPDVVLTAGVPPKAPEGSQRTWAELVRACNGDTVRAGRMIAGEVGLDPSLSPDSDLAIARAYSRLHS